MRKAIFVGLLLLVASVAVLGVSCGGESTSGEAEKLEAAIVSTRDLLQSAKESTGELSQQEHEWLQDVDAFVNEVRYISSDLLWAKSALVFLVAESPQASFDVQYATRYIIDDIDGALSRLSVMKILVVGFTDNSGIPILIREALEAVDRDLSSALERLDQITIKSQP